MVSNSHRTSLIKKIDSDRWNQILQERELRPAECSTVHEIICDLEDQNRPIDKKIRAVELRVSKVPIGYQQQVIEAVRDIAVQFSRLTSDQSVHSFVQSYV